VRNPPTTSHTPGADEGCTIFVKLWQFDLDDRTQFRKEMGADLADLGKGVSAQTLHQDAQETVRFITLAADAVFAETPQGGAELLMIEGDATEGSDTLAKGTWLRVPDGDAMQVTGGKDGAKFWIKTGHLPFAKAPDV
jgi:hypothetical protein